MNLTEILLTRQTQHTTVHSLTKSQLILQPIDLSLQGHQLILNLFCSRVGLAYFMKNS